MRPACITGTVSTSCDDGTRLRNDCGDHSVLLRLRECTTLGGEDCRDLSTLLGAAVLAAPLRLRNARCQVGSNRCWQSEGIFMMLFCYLGSKNIYYYCFMAIIQDILR